MNEEMIAMLSAEPWLKSVRSAGSKDSSVRPSKPAPKTMAGFEQEPKSRAEEVAATEAAGVAAAATELLTAGQSPDVLETLATGTALDTDEATGAALLLLDEVAVTPATAAVISAAVASSTNRF